MKYSLCRNVPDSWPEVIEEVQLPSLEEAKKKAEELGCDLIDEEDEPFRTFERVHGVWEQWDMDDDEHIEVELPC